jgi:hypothetical protein
VFGVAAGLAVAAAIWARATGPGPAPDRQASALPTPGRQASALPTPGRHASAPAVVPSSAGTATAARTDWAAALGELDAVRARAFAAREPRLLGQVYVPGPLLDADAALIERIVPAGCGLVGARTHYGHVRGAVRGASVHVTATATLPPTRLMCHGRTAGTARPVGPTTLHVTLRRTPGGLRIANEREA